MNNIINIFNNEEFGSIRTLKLDDQVYFVASDAAKALGYKKPNNAINAHCKHTLKQGIVDTTGFEQQMNIIPESDLYRLIIKSTLPEAEKFENWIMEEVLPTIRKSGCYIEEAAEEEAIDFQTKFGIRRIRKTFNNASDLRDTYEEYKELSKEEYKKGRIDNSDKIKATKIIIDTLEYKLVEDALNLRGSELLAIQELLTDIHKDLVKLNNKRSGGLLATKTKEIKRLEAKLNGEEKLYYFIDKHPFSNNYMYEYNKDAKCLVKTPAYNRWINKLHLEEYLPDELEDVDFTKPIKIDLLYGHLPKFDTMNFDKAIIDQISRYYNFDDSLIHECKQTRYEYVDSYKDGYIYIDIKNIY